VAAPPPVPIPPGAHGAAPSFTGAPAISDDDGLPPSPTPWDFQLKLAGFSNTVLGVVRQSGVASSGPWGGLLERMVRASLLDPKTYRQAALDETGMMTAWQVAAIAFIATALGPMLDRLGNLSLSTLIYLVGQVVAQLVSFAAGAAAVTWLMPSVAKVKLSFGQVFRPLAYAQAPGVLGIIPGFGSLLGFWRLFTFVAAIREISGCEAGKAVILMLIGFVGSLVAAAVLSPIIIGLFAVFG
jgi:hypothetical protein